MSINLLRRRFEDCWTRTISSLHLMKNDQMIWRIFVESTRYFESKKHPEWERGFSQTRKSARSWMWRSACIKKRSGIEIMVESLYRDRTVSRVRIVNGNNKHVTETLETICFVSVEHRVTGKPVAKAKPQTKPTVTLSPISILVRERNWIDINPKRFREDCFAVSKPMIRLLRHDPSILREDDGAVRFDNITEESKAKFDGSSQWPMNDWITCLVKGGGPKKRFQCCLNPNSSEHFLYFRAAQGLSGGNLVDPALQDNVLLPEDFTEYIYYVGSLSEIHSTIRSGLIPGGKSLKRHRQSVFLTAVKPMDDDQSMAEIRHDLDKPRIVPYTNTWRPHQNTLYWCSWKLAQKKRLQFYQTRSHAIVLHNTTFDLYWKALCMKTKEVLYHNVIPISKVASSYTEAEFVKWTTGSTWAWSKKILSTPKRFGKLRSLVIIITWPVFSLGDQIWIL